MIWLQMVVLISLSLNGFSQNISTEDIKILQNLQGYDAFTFK